MLKSYLHSIYANALILNDDLVIQAARDFGPRKVVLDVGCWDGEKSTPFFDAIGATERLGIEPVESAVKDAEKAGIKVSGIAADRDVWPWKDNSIDCIVSNQVVEHLSNLDHYFSEAARVLKPGGILISSTNNLASWHNIFSLLFAWAPFDLTNSSRVQGGIGNPLALHKGEQDDRGESWTHKCIYTARWLFEWQQVYKLKRVKLYTAGYHPFPAKVGQYLQRHAAFIITVTEKESLPKSSK